MPEPTEPNRNETPTGAVIRKHVERLVELAADALDAHAPSRVFGELGRACDARR